MGGQAQGWGGEEQAHVGRAGTGAEADFDGARTLPLGRIECCLVRCFKSPSGPLRTHHWSRGSHHHAAPDALSPPQARLQSEVTDMTAQLVAVTEELQEKGRECQALLARNEVLQRGQVRAGLHAWVPSPG